MCTYDLLYALNPWACSPQASAYISGKSLVPILQLVRMECCGHANCLCISINREESNVRKDKESPWCSRKINHGTTVS